MPTTNYQYTGVFAPGTYVPIFDPTGALPANLVTGEKHTLTSANGQDYHVAIPLFAPFFATGLSISFTPSGSSTSVPLLEGLDYNLVYQFIGATRGCAIPVYGGIAFINNSLNGIVSLNSYRTIGGNWTLNQPAINTLLANQIQNPRVTSWEQIVGVPTVFPVVNHQWNLQDLVGATSIVNSINSINDTLLAQNSTLGAQAITIVNTHIADTSDPHPQYSTTAEVNAIIATAGFKGSYVGIASLIGTDYSVPALPVTLTTGIFSLKFNQENPENSTLTISGYTRPLTDIDGNVLSAKEIKQNQIRTVINTGNSFVVMGTTKFLSMSENSNAFTGLVPQDAVRFNNGNFTKAIADGTSPNNTVVGFADTVAKRVVYSGIMSGFAGLVTDTVYYLSPTTAGAITGTKPFTDAIRVGIAKSSTELFVGILPATTNDSVPSGGNGDKIFYLNDQIITSDYVIPANKNAFSTGPITIADGVTVDIVDGATWTIL